MKTMSDKQLLQATFDEVGRVKVELTEIRDEMHGKFDSIDRKFDSIDQKFDKIDHRFDNMDHKLDKILSVVTDKFHSHDKRIKRLEVKVGVII